MRSFSLFALGCALVLPSTALAICVAGDPTNPENDCDMDGCTIRQGDCADNPTANPLASTIRGPGCPNGPALEVCDNQDNNCNGSVDEGNPGGGAACTTGQSGVCSPGTLACTAGSVQCVRSVNPSVEVCDGLDNNCNGSVDEGNPGGGAACSTGQQGVCAGGTRQCTAGALQCVRVTGPSTETCDGLDNNCNGTVDEGFNVNGACTSSNPGVCAPGTFQCAGGVAVCTSTIAPGTRTETCNALDDNCNGQTDENNPGGGGACTTGQQGVCAAGVNTCSAGALSCVRTTGPSTEICDGLDNNCNGTVDDGFNVGAACTVGGQQGVCAMGTNRCQANGTVACIGGTASAEVCDGLDNNCNGSVDEGNPGGGGACSTGLQGVCSAGTRQCQTGALRCVQNVMSSAEVCDGLDNNCNGVVDDGLIVDVDGDGVRACGTCGAPAAPNCDCNDNNAAIKPGAAEVCDNVDNNCNGQIDENVNRVCYTGPAGSYTGTCPGPGCAPRGVCRGATQACTAGTFPTCDGSTPGQTFPGTEVCDNLDNNCNGQVDEGLSGGACSTGQLGVCAAGTERCTAGTLQCQRNVNPSTELCDNLDNNCDGLVDNGVTPQRCFTGMAGTFTGTCPGPTCTPRGQCRAGTQQCDGAGTWLACGGQTLPAAETCNTSDDDCDGNIDNGLITDADGDGSRACGTCGAPAAGACDCNDANAQVKPGRAEVCNAIDDNCNGTVDEGSGPGGKLSQNCYSGPGGTQGVGVCTAGTQVCNATVPGTASFGACMGEVTPSAETCDAKDNNCDGTVDNGFDADGDGFFSCALCNNAPNCDCNDNDPTIKPGAVELCDTIDQNCNGRLDDVPARRCFAGPFVTPDTYTGTCPGPQCNPKGVCMAGTQTCSAQGAWGSCAGATLPANDPAGAELLCDNRDEDCDGVVDDGNFDVDLDGVKSCQGDCNDNDPTIKPGALEICDGKDNNCDGTIDGVNTACYDGPASTRGKGLCRDGTQQCVNGVGSGVCLGQVLPAPLPDGGVPRFVDGGVNDPELVCDGKDEDCDGIVDDGFDQDHDGVTTCQGDCDDHNAFNKPGGAEICDCQDNNCDTKIDEGNVCLAAPCHDFDFDGFTNCQGDCDDHNAAIGPQRTEIVGNHVDDDCDGAIDEDTDEDGDGYTTAQGDCDDHFAAINPGAVEVCDGFDNNCNNKVDEGFDQDGDFATTCAGDCDDHNPNRSPFKNEICGNMIDDNCDGRVDEDTDADGDGVTTCQGDCNDFQASVHPAAGSVAAAPEICDGQDNDCNGKVDEGFDQDHDFVATCFGDCNDADPNVNPNVYEIPGNHLDDNCNGKVDEGATDVDLDGFSPICGDCNDADPTINPHATEVCDRVDNNCDSYIDSSPGNFNLCAVCFDADHDGQTNCDGDCNDADPTIFRGAPELCDLKDNDCDGDVDLDPATGLKVCVDDAGMPIDPDAGTDAGSGSDDGGAGGDGGSTGERPIVSTGCGCSSPGDLSPLFGLGLVALVLRARRRAAVLVTVVALSGCTSALTTPPTEDAGGAGDDAGVDAGYRPPVPDWLCPGLYPVEQLTQVVPGTTNVFAYPRDYAVVKNEAAQFVVLDDAARNIAGFIARRPVPSDIDPAAAGALETVAAREIAALAALAGTPLVRDRIERFSRVYEDDRLARNFSHGETLTFATATNAFAVRNRLIASLSGHTPAEIGALPQPASAHPQDQLVVYLLFRLTQTDLFVGAAVAPLDTFAQTQPALSDLTNGSHLSGRNGSLAFDCEDRTAPALKTDFIFVVDDSASMLEEQTALANAADGLFSAFQRSGLDFRIGVVTTDGDVLRGAGFTNDLDAFKSDVRVGINGNGLEMGIEFGLRAVRRAKAATDPAFKVRSDAALVVILMSDEENTPLEPLTDYVHDYTTEGAVAFAITGPRPTGCTRVGLGKANAGTQYIDLATRTGGSSGSICNPNITEVVEEILFGSIGASTRSPLEKRPISGSISVDTTMPVPRARTNGFDYDPASNSVLFFGAVPPAGSHFKAAYAFFNYID